MVVLTGGQALQPTTAVGQLPENVRRPFLVCLKRYPLAIRCSSWGVV
jgi:hypothetical protein